MRHALSLLLLTAGLTGAAPWTSGCFPQVRTADPTDAEIQAAFARQGRPMNGAEAAGIRANVLLALREARSHGLGNSKVDFAAVEIARDLGLGTDPASLKRVVTVVGELMGRRPAPDQPRVPPPSWHAYFQETTNLWHQADFMQQVNRAGFHPVKISWEDIGRHANSVWGDRISDVGIWVREHEADPQSARLALSVRRDGNFRDKVLMVPSEKIKVHVKEYGRTVEKTLPQRLHELGLTSQTRDRNVIVSNQFAVVPVPSREMRGASPEGVPPRAAFTFSIFPYGSTNFVITDVIEGSSDATVGPGNHQLLYANVNGSKAPFTASRAEDRQDLLRLERELKAKGMDVDVQRYYLIQIPLKRNVRGLQTSQMGTPPMGRACEVVTMSEGVLYDAMPMAAPSVVGVAQFTPGVTSDASKGASMKVAKEERAGLSKVAIGTGDTEGGYFVGAGWRGQRAEEPIRVTVIYFVTPVGRVTGKDMEAFTRAFQQWDNQAIWGGSFVTKE